jgi:hypothetical protein
MSKISRNAARRVRYTLAAATIAGAGMASLVGLSGTAHASTNGYVVEQSCTNVAGTVHYTPGLIKKRPRQVEAVLTSTLAGCSNIFSGAQSGTGTFTAVLSGSSKLGAENFSGPFTIDWPASSGLNPSTGSLSVAQSGSLENVSGTITGGAFTGAPIALQYLLAGNTGAGTKLSPVTAQNIVNSQSLTVSVNEG